MKLGPQTEAADRLHAMKYRAPGEDYKEAINRIAFALKDGDDHYHQFRDVILPQRFLPAGRVQSGAGSSKFVTLLNCYVSGTFVDSYVDGPGSIMQRAHEAASTMRMGGGIGYDFSTLRPRGALIKKLQSHASGPVSFMGIFNEICLCTASAGERRGAQMGVLRCDHPDIEEFIHAKNNQDRLRGFNLSVGVTDELMEAVAAGTEFDLRWGGQVYRTIDARELWEKIMRSTFYWAEPGVIFLDQINRMNNLWYAEQIAACNPCSEQSLPPFGACLLGSFNLVKYITSQPAPIGQSCWSFDYDLLRNDIPIIVRGMDNVVDKAKYPLAEQKAEALTKRRMGIGVTGLANTAEALGYAYGSSAFLAFEDEVLSTISAECYRASALLAAEKGVFPLYDQDRYLAGQFVKTLPDDVLDLIRRHGIRNSHLTSIAPTGTISMCADNVSSALEPVFSYRIDRPINTPSGQVIETIEDYGAKFLNVRGKLAVDVTAQEHLDVLCHAQRWVDSAVSKTVNMDGRKMSWEAFKDIYRVAWENGAKGCSTFNLSGKRGALLTASDDAPEIEEGAACEYDLATGRRTCE